MPDRYENFAALAAREIEGVHYRIRLVERPSPVAVMAPHGGFIEPGASEAASAIAADRFSLYCFESLTKRAKGEGLHITSTRFDEPRALTLVESAEVVIGVHGRKNGADEASIWIGGLHERLRDAICGALNDSDFAAKTVGAGHRLAGRDPANICNRGKRGAGVQLELPRALRIRFSADAARREAFAAAVRAAIEREIRPPR